MRWPNRTVKERFEEKIYYGLDGCWYWIGSINNSNYGSFAWNGNTGGRMVSCLAHRVSYELYKGNLDPNLLVCHTCDNTTCVNPDHLFLGTHQDNKNDQIKKGRLIVGSRISTAVLTSDDVVYIRSQKGIIKPRILAEKYNVDLSTIYGALKGRYWKHIPMPESGIREKINEISTVTKLPR